MSQYETLRTTLVGLRSKQGAARGLNQIRLDPAAGTVKRSTRGGTELVEGKLHDDGTFTTRSTRDGDVRELQASQGALAGIRYVNAYCDLNENLT